MKITFSNLGAIKKTTLDLRPLTVIIGPNNSNKTYIAYSVYGLLQALEQKAGQFIYDTKLELDTDTSISLKIDDKFFDLYLKDCERIIEEFTKKIDIFFANTNYKLFERVNFKIDLSKKKIKEAFHRWLKIAPSIKNHKYNFNDNILRIDYDLTSLERDKESNKEDALVTIVVGIRYSLFSLPFLLPAERNTLITIYKLLTNERFKILRENQRELINRLRDQGKDALVKLSNNSNYPKPIEDFLDFLNDIERAGNEFADEDIAYFAKVVEENIQSKNRILLKNANYGGKELKNQVKKNLEIDLYNSSSSIKQLASLLLFLRYKAEYDDLLIIDEPEMNLHPESQAKLLEVLAMLVNAGVKVLLTTHSPYFMSHLNNLISGDMENEEVRGKQAESLYLQDARAFLKPEDVSAYEMRKDKTGKHQELFDLHDEDYGIRWDTLSDVSADIQQKYFEIYEKTKETSSDGEEE